MAPRPRKKHPHPTPPLDFYRAWCHQHKEEHFLALLESSTDLAPLWAGHALQQLHPVVLALFDINVSTTVLPGPETRKQQRRLREAAYRAVGVLRPIEAYIHQLKNSPEYREAEARDIHREKARKGIPAYLETDPFLAVQSQRGAALTDKIALLENALSILREDYWRLSRAWWNRVPEKASKTPRPTIASPRPEIPSPRKKQRPRGTFGDALTPHIYLLAQSLEALTHTRNWTCVANLLQHFGAREFPGDLKMNVRARSRVAAFQKASSADLPLLHKEQTRRIQSVFPESLPLKKDN